MKKQKNPVEMLTLVEYAQREGVAQQTAYLRCQTPRLRRPNGNRGWDRLEGRIMVYSDAIWSPLKPGPAIGSHWTWAKKAKKAKKSKK